MEEYEEEVALPLQCITEHPGFRSVCLDRYVLETAYYQYRQQYGMRHGDDENKWVINLIFSKKYLFFLGLK